MKPNDNLEQINKQRKDFCAKYQELLKKYDTSLLTKTRRIIEQRKETRTISLPDAEKQREKIQKEISYNLSHMNEDQDEISRELSSPKTVEIDELEAVRMTMRYIRKDIPALLNRNNFAFSLEVLRGATESADNACLRNVRRVNKLRELEVTILFSFLHACYKQLPSIIKGGENKNAETEKKRTV